MFDFFSTKGFKDYLKKAKAILAANWTGRYTKPSPSLYPHQWNWDSGFVAMGYAHYNQQRAQQEILSLFSHQWENGMVPQIVFNPAALGNYFPEPDFWQAPGGRLSSGITMPPVHATACLKIYHAASNKKQAAGFLREIFPKLLASHKYLYRYRDPEETGLVYIRHPWESGMDNSPSWDGPLKAIKVDKSRLPHYQRKDLGHGVPAEQRPSDEDYDRYVYLVDLFRSLKYHEELIYEQCPFKVADVLFNSILCRAGRDLIDIAEIIGQGASELSKWHSRTARAIGDHMWSRQRSQFDPICLISGKKQPAPTAASFMPLYAAAPNQEQAQTLYERLNSVSFCALHQGNCFTIPNFDMAHEEFDSHNYWRGPVWININWMLSQGLRLYGFREKSDSMNKDIIQLPVRFGFHEYFDSITGQGYGSGGFSWTAALFIDLVQEYYDQNRRALHWVNWGEAKGLRSPRVINVEGRAQAEPDGRLATRLMGAIRELNQAFYDMERGRVDYPAMKESEPYREYLALAAQLRGFDPGRLTGRKQKLAFWINLYNTLVVHGIVELDIESSVRQVSNFFTHIRYQIGDLTYSLDEIEHGILRSNARPPYRLFSAFGSSDPRAAFSLDEVDPRIHFALVCGSRSCAPVRFYDAEKIDAELDTAARNFINSSEVVILPEENKILLSQIFNWYSKDMGSPRELFSFLLTHLDQDKKALYLEQHQSSIKVEYLFYDWNLNRFN